MPNGVDSIGRSYRYRWEWFDRGGAPWPSENEGRWPKERFDTYGVVKDYGTYVAVVCVTGRHKPDFDEAVRIAAVLNAAEGIEVAA